MSAPSTTATTRPPLLSAGRRSALVGPLVVGGLSLVSCAILAFVDPNGGPPTCPLKAMTGLDCPFCGGLRGTHALLTGDVAGALDQNLLLPVFLVGSMLAWLVWFRASWQGRRVTWRGGRTAAVAVTSALLVFAVVRNLPDVSYLPSGLG